MFNPIASVVSAIATAITGDNDTFTPVESAEIAIRHYRQLVMQSSMGSDSTISARINGQKTVVREKLASVKDAAEHARLVKMLRAPIN